MASGFELPENGTGGGRGIYTAGFGGGGFTFSFFLGFASGLYGFIFLSAAATPIALATSAESSCKGVSEGVYRSCLGCMYTFSKLGRLTGSGDTSEDVCCESEMPSLNAGMEAGGCALEEMFLGSSAGFIMFICVLKNCGARVMAVARIT